jgi:hypothetical protein
MGQVRHGSATTTHAVRAAIMRACPPLVRGPARMIASFDRVTEPGVGHQPQDSGEVAQASDGRGSEDRGPSEPRSTVLTEAEEAMAAAFRRHTLLPLDDGLYALQPSIPHLTRSALHRCLQRLDLHRFCSGQVLMLSGPLLEGHG